MVLALVFRNTWRKQFARISRGIGSSTRSGLPTSSSRELTADELAGANVGQPIVDAPRRTRRTRRTPSQISTVSLPVYNKEAGAQELVVNVG